MGKQINLNNLKELDDESNKYQIIMDNLPAIFAKEISKVN
jgi:hypothetical protein